MINPTTVREAYDQLADIRAEKKKLETRERGLKKFIHDQLTQAPDYTIDNIMLTQHTRVTVDWKGVTEQVEKTFDPGTVKVFNRLVEQNKRETVITQYKEISEEEEE